MFLDKFIHFGENLEDQVKDRSPKKVKSLIEVPYVALLNVQFPSFNMNLFSSPSHDPSPCSPFRGNLRSGKVSFLKKKLKSLIELP